jgi:hypothetical protein
MEKPASVPPEQPSGTTGTILAQPSVLAGKFIVPLLERLYPVTLFPLPP